MTESWQYKKYYKPRVLIPVTDVLDSALPPMTLVCLSAGELCLLRNVLDYCHRRSTFVVTYGKDTYVSPDNETWDLLQAVVAGLEGKLMSGCEDLIEKLEAIATSIDGSTAAIEGTYAELEAARAALECICANMPDSTDMASMGPILDTYLDSDQLNVDDPYPGQETPGLEADACAIAQLVWSFSYEMLTEVVQPLQTGALAVLLPAAVLAITGWVGALALSIPIGAIMYYLREAINAWARGSLDGVVNTWYTNKEEVVCAAYEVLATESTYSAASQAMYDVIDALPDVSPIDKLVFKAMCAPWVFGKMADAWTNQTTWATARVTAGYCLTCSPDFVGSDWVAVYYDAPNKVVHIEHYAGSYWASGCWNYTVPTGYTLAGVFFRVLNETGTCSLKRMESSTTCGGTAIFYNASEDLTPAWYFARKTGQFNDTQCLATVYPTATPLTGMEHRASMPISALFQTGYNCTGSVDISIEYLVFKGTTPPP